MVFFIPVAVVVAAAQAASAMISGTIAATGWVGTAASAVANSKIGAPVAHAISKIASTVVQSTPPVVKDFIINTGNKIIDTQKKLNDFVENNTPQKGTPASTALEAAKKADDMKEYGDKLSSVAEKFESSQKAGEKTKPSESKLKEKEKPSSTTLQLDSQISQDSKLPGTAKIPPPPPC